MACSLLFAPLRRWPWVWLVPLFAYFLVIASVPALRRSFNWFHLGRVSAGRLAATVAVITITILGLLLFQSTTQPELRVYRAAVPSNIFGGVVATGAIFSILNATLEELVFRGVLFDALLSQWSKWVTVLGTSVLFGLGHMHGYPPGVLGVCLATLFGFVLGALRFWTGGLAMPIVVHMGADATIYGILSRHSVG